MPAKIHTAEWRAKNRRKALAHYRLNRDKINEARRGTTRPLDHWFHKAVARGKKETAQRKADLFSAIQSLEKRLAARVYARLVRALRRRLNVAFRAGRQYSKTARDLLGCEIPHLKKHLESLWSEGMTWENYGYEGWHIDHILPCAKFDLSNPAERQKCFHFTNLQPLWARDNYRKRDA